MNVRLVAPPWGAPALNEELEEAIKVLNDNIWRDSSIQFYSVRNSKQKMGKSAPKGMQRFLNDVLKERFHSYGWIGEAGYFFKNKTWIRITFRHQMSLGSDIIDAIKVCKKENMDVAVIMAANRQTLNLISPNDSAAIVSFEKLQREVVSLDGAIDIPLIIGELTPRTSASEDINHELLKDRPRDISIPVSQKDE